MPASKGDAHQRKKLTIKSASQIMNAKVLTAHILLSIMVPPRFVVPSGWLTLTKTFVKTDLRTQHAVFSMESAKAIVKMEGVLQLEYTHFL